MPQQKRTFATPSSTRRDPAYLAVRALVAVIWLCSAAMATEQAVASDVPDPAALERALRVPAQTIEVVEPHLSTAERQTIVAYRGWPAAEVLDHLLGSRWREPGLDVEFRALDGYVSHIPSERFSEYPAYLVFASPDLPGFTIDNPSQNEKDVPLGPYYLVWDNIGHPDLLADGATYWPYQVSEVLVSDTGLAALLPGDMAKQYAEDASLTRKYCLSCHRINGYGGDKWPIDLAESVKDMTADHFERWVLTPNAVKPGTTMPPLPERMPAAEREAIARQLYGYLRAVPAQTP